MKPTIITLAPDVQIEGVSFEEAFGEHSEARGRGRARRKARKLERIQNRREVRAARQEAKNERRRARIEGRQEAQQARMAKRQAAMEARQARRTTRKTLREERRAIGEEQEPLNQDGMVMGEAPVMPTPTMEQTQAEPQGFNEAPMPETSAPQAGEGGYAPQPTYMTPPQRGTEYQEEVGMYGESDTETGEEPLGDNEDAQGDESSFDAETMGESSSFDSENYNADGEYDSADGDYENANGQVNIKSGMKARLMRAKKTAQPLDNRISVLQDKIRLHESQAENLKTALRNGKLPSNRLAVGAKELKARAIHLDSLRKKLAMAQEAKRKQGIVPVPASLDPKIEKNKIVIPASSADGQESYMFEGQDEMSSFDGKNFWDKNKGIIMGLGVAAIAIYALNKYKVFK